MPSTQLLLLLPRLPFAAAFDILFAHGGFAAFARVHGGSTPEALYQFWRLFFVASPVGKLHPARISHWVEVMCACHVVQSLAHPAHAVYLLRPVVLEIPESVAAWSVAGGRGNQLLDTESLVRAMRVFLPAGDTGFLQSEWFSVAEVRKQRSVAGWRAFADEVVQNHAFTRYWWSGQREGPFYLVQSSMSSMGEMITKLVQREMVGLSNALRREETAKAMQKLKRDREKRKWLAGLDEADNAKKAKPDSPSTPSSSKAAQGAKKKKNPDPPSTFSSPSSNHSSASPPPKSNTLSSAAKQEISRLTYLHHTQHISILAQVQQALSSMGSAVFKAHFKHIMCLIVSLGHQHPRVRWSLRQALHKRAAGGFSVWEVERQLYRWMYRRDVDPLQKLVRLAEKKFN